MQSNEQDNVKRLNQVLKNSRKVIKVYLDKSPSEADLLIYHLVMYINELNTLW